MCSFNQIPLLKKANALPNHRIREGHSRLINAVTTTNYLLSSRSGSLDLHLHALRTTCTHGSTLKSAAFILAQSTPHAVVLIGVKRAF